MQFNIEERMLTTEESHRASFEPESRTMRIEADDFDAAVASCALAEHSQVLSLVRPIRGGEAVATVRLEETVFLWRISRAS